MKHSKEPWHNQFDELIVGGEEGKLICQFFGKYQGEFDNSQANAARIVACVNACAGLDNPEQIRSMYEQMKTGIYKLENHRIGKPMYERDELLAALEGIIEYTTMEFAERNGFGPQRLKVSEVYDKVKWGTPNTGGGQSK